MSNLIAINRGAFNLAIQALKRAGKDEIAEQLELDCEFVPDLIKHLQQRNAELIERHPEWACYTCNTVYPVETVKKISDCICPSGCGGSLRPSSQTERLLEQRNCELEHQRDKALSDSDNWSAAHDKKEAKCDELAARVERFENAIRDLDEMDVDSIEYGEQLLFILSIANDETPQDNLNHVKREALIQLAEHMTAGYGIPHLYGGDDVRDYANTKYPSVKE